MDVKRISAEIKARYEEVADRIFDFQGSDILPYMDFEDAKPFLKDGVTAEQLIEARDEGGPLKAAFDYMPFAWEKANDCRGLSAGRSVDHLKAWLWFAGYDLDADFDRLYQFYGKPCLVIASELLGFDWRAEDNDRWVNDETGPPISTQLREAHIKDAIEVAEKHRQHVNQLHA